MVAKVVHEVRSVKDIAFDQLNRFKHIVRLRDTN